MARRAPADSVSDTGTVESMNSTIDPLTTVARKREGHPLTRDEIADLVERYTDGRVSDALMSAFTMAVCCKGMTVEETTALCDAMINSGKRLDLPSNRPLVDKHSTGGVGDKTSLVLAPMLAAIGAGVPMLSGRGLGHTGGTLDKLEAIPGFRVVQSSEEIAAALRAPGCVICAAHKDLAPADAKLYALRDATATVPALPLIAASIMSKKIAEGTDALVLDVKVGAGAFLPDIEQARELATAMVALGTRAGVRTRALLTDMSTPLGNAVGNTLEVVEALETLAGGGPADLRELVATLARHMAELAGIGEDPVATLDDGRAMDAWRAMVVNQGGDPDAKLTAAPVVHPVHAERSGILTGIDALGIGQLAWRLGAGRSVPGEKIDHRVGLTLAAKPGDVVQRGSLLATIHAADETSAASAAEAFAETLAWDTRGWLPGPLVLDIIS